MNKFSEIDNKFVENLGLMLKIMSNYTNFTHHFGQHASNVVAFAGSSFALPRTRDPHSGNLRLDIYGKLI